MPAGDAINLRLLRGHEPVADVVLRVCAEPVAFVSPRERAPQAVHLFQRGNKLLVG
jgi:hypothetical protein